MIQKYEVICSQCQASRLVEIDPQGIIDWLSNNPNPYEVKIISGRRRMDNVWGWQCICGNDDLLMEAEKSKITNKQNPDPTEISDLAKTLVPEDSKFRMRKI